MTDVVDEFNKLGENLVAQSRANPDTEAVECESQAPELLPEADMLSWEDVAEEEIDSVFVEGFVTGTMSLIVAPGGTGKSYLALILAISVALGRPLLPRFTPTRRGPVLYCNGEDDRRQVSRRIKAICIAHNIEPGDVTRAISEGRLSFILGKAEALLYFGYGGVAKLTEAHDELIRRALIREYRLIVVDPIVGWAGVQDENDNPQMHQAAQAMIRMAQACGGCTLGVHHQAKQSSRGRETTTATGRGATSLTDASRWQATLQPLDPKNKLGVPEVEVARFIELHVGKNSYAERDARPLYLQRIGGALVGKDLAPKPNDALNLLARRLSEKIGANHDDLAKWSILQNSPGAEFRRELKAEHGKDATKENLIKAYAVAIENGLIVEDDGADGAKIPRATEGEFVEWP